ncbi:glycerophosphodiester phosphodiesterase family protein [Prescottella defluvii]|nr:glycerophosphodiester phosphodiesterase family protein [Prescottella defluvii]
MNRPLIIAHRGNSSVAPENTMLSFRSAVLAGADMIEIDVHVDRDVPSS